jgi:hypothetical protein
MDYARSVRKFNVQPTALTTFYMLGDQLFHREKHSHHRAKKTPPQGDPATPAPSSGGDAQVPANDVQQDLEYVVPVTLGTPGTTLVLDFDTGSSDLWVWSTLLKASASNTKGHTLYDPTKSSTATAESNLKWNISYGDGSSASGSVYLDEVVLGTSTSRIAIPNQAIEVATKLSSSFLTETDSDGLLGLAFPALNTVTPTPQNTPMQNMIDQGLIQQPIFTVKLDKGDSSGFYTFGYIDETVLPEGTDIVYSDVDSSYGFWEFPSPSIQIGTQTESRGTGNTAIADTGTTLILLSDQAVQDIYNTISGAKLDNSAGGYVLPTDSTPPNISFAVGTADNIFTIAGEDLKFADAGNGMSFGAIQSRGQNPQDILGDVCLKRVYAVFDQTPNNPRIGFGQRLLD